MNKKLQFKSLLVLVALLLGGANYAWGEEPEIIWSEDFTGLKADDVPTAPTNTSYTGVKYTCVDGGSATKIYEAELAGGTSPELLVGKKGDKVVGSFTAVIPLDNYEGTLTLTYYQNKQTLKVYSTTDGVSGGQTIKPTEVGQQTTTFTGITKDMTSITIVFEATTTNNVRLDNIVLSYIKPSSVADPTFNPEGGRAYTSTQSVIIDCATTGATKHYTTDGTEPTASSSTYSDAISVSSTTTIKAIAIKGGESSSIVSATYLITEHAGTADDPYSVADARNAITANTGVEDVYATGIVSKIVTTYSTEYKNITFNISTDGLETSDQLQAYRCKGATGVDASDVKVGDVVVVKGKLTKHNDIYEFGQDNELISLQHPVIPIISATPASLTELSYVAGNGPSSAKSFSVTGDNLKADITLSLEASSNFEISLTEDSGYGNSLTISQTDGSVAATTVYVRLISGLTLGTYNGTITLASTDAAEKTISLTGSVEAANVTWDLSKASYEEITDEDVVTWSNEYATMTNSSKGGGTKASNYLGEDANHRTSSRFYTNNTLTVTPANGYTITSIEFSATSDSYASSLASSTWSNASAEANEKTVTVTPTDGTKTISAIIGGTCGFTAVKVYYEESSSVVENVTVTIPTDKYTTFSSPYAVDFSEADVTVYKAKVNDGVVVLSPISNSIVPANTGVILFAETANDYTGKVTTGGSVSDNELVAAISETKLVYKNNDRFNYILQGGVFKKATGDKLKAGKAYLNTNYDVTTSADGARELKIVVEGEATAIKAIETAADKNVYDLQGRKVAAPTKGLYIINGKKMIVK